MTMTRPSPLAAPRRPALARLSALAVAVAALAGCMQPVTAVPQAPAAPAPVLAPVVPSRPVPAITPVAPPPPPPVPVPAGPTDARSGLHQAAVLSITGDADSRFTLLFRPALTDAGRIAAAPAQLCRQAGRDLAGSRSNTPGTASAMPGVQMMIVTCTAA